MQTFLLVSVLAGAIVAAMCLPVVGSVAFATKEASSTFDSLPDQLKSLPLPQRSYMVAADGSRIATLYAENRIVVPLEQISPLLQKGLIDTEDVRFYQHRGVDLKAAVRALVANSSAGDVQQGSSTITMQYVRNLLITNATTKEEIAAARVQTLGRKLQEMKYALAIEKQLTKAQILGGYLNVAYFGAGAYGAEAAARRYFNVSAADLTLSQAATLAGIVQQPVAFDPTKHPEAAQTRRNIVLERMVAAGDITAAQSEIAKATSVKKSLNPREQPNGCTAGPYPFFCAFVLNQIKNDPRYGATQAARTDLLKRGAFTIQTTLDPKKQAVAQSTVDKYIPQNDRSRKAAAVAMVEPGTGKVLALAENRTWGTAGAGKTAYNYAVNAADGGTIGMQAGSTFKIFTIAAAFEKGLNPNDYIDSPQTKTFGGGDWGCGSERFKAYTVNNSTGAGTFNMWQGAALSINTYFMELERQAGLCRTVDIAERMGVTLANGKPLLRYPSFTLGTMEVSPLAVAGAYATMANHGVYCRSHAIVSITNFAGKPQYADDGSCRQAVSREVADATTAVLSGVIDGNIGGRTGQAMSIGRDAAGKTGTTDSNSAVWFAGYTPELSTAVWVGDPRGGFEHPLQNVTINGQYYDQVHGGSLPGPIWRDVMLGALDGTPPRDFDLKASFNLTQARKGGVGQAGGSSSWDSTYGQQMQPDPQYNPYYYYKPQTTPNKRP